MPLNEPPNPLSLDVSIFVGCGGNHARRSVLPGNSGIFLPSVRPAQAQELYGET